MLMPLAIGPFCCPQSNTQCTLRVAIKLHVVAGLVSTATFAQAQRSEHLPKYLGGGGAQALRFYQACSLRQQQQERLLSCDSGSSSVCGCGGDRIWNPFRRPQFGRCHAVKALSAEL